MRIVVSDTSCMIDLRKAALLQAILRLPYTFVMPDTLFADEWLCLTAEEKRTLCALGLEVRTLPGPLVERARQTQSRYTRLTVNDCFALALAEDIGDCVLLTGDGLLRRIAEGNGLEVRGVLWVTDELETHAIASPADLHAALQILDNDDLVFLPKEELARRLKRLARAL
jgi:predicted nucleic acid-binding protein